MAITTGGWLALGALLLFTSGGRGEQPRLEERIIALEKDKTWARRQGHWKSVDFQATAAAPKASGEN